MGAVVNGTRDEGAREAGCVMDLMTLEHFMPHVGSSFRAETDSGTVDLVLQDAVAAPPSGLTAKGRTPFSLTFLGPGPVMAQRIFHLTHPALGELDVFLVPIGASADEVTYEAVFA